MRSKTTSYTSENTVIFNKPVRLYVVLHRLGEWRTKQILEVLFESVIYFLSYCGTHVTTQHLRTCSQTTASICHIIALNKFIRRKNIRNNACFLLLTVDLFQFIAMFFNTPPFFIALDTYIFSLCYSPHE